VINLSPYRRWPPASWHPLAQFLAFFGFSSALQMAFGQSPGESVFLTAMVAVGVWMMFWMPRIRRITEAPSVRFLEHPDPNTIRATIGSFGYETRMIGESPIRSTAELAAALDETLGPFQYPDDPREKVLAHFGHEARGAGKVALVWFGARHFQEAEPELFAAIVETWVRGAGLHAEDNSRLLFLDAPRPANATERAQSAA